jgi:potassium-transporting ATPase potassium-binding subunit
LTVFTWLQIAVYLFVLLLLVKPLGSYMARVFQGERNFLSPIIGPIERFIYKILGVHLDEEMNWKMYASAILILTLFGLITLYGLQRLQSILPLNPQHLGNVSPNISFNTSVSFNTNTNWQSYSGETTMSYLTQILGLGVQNFISAAAGMAVLVALVRGFTRHSVNVVGNAWVDMTRAILYILIPLSLILSIVLVSQGVVQTLSASKTTTLVEMTQDANGQQVTEQTISVGPAASQIAIKQLGTNGGGFFNTNSSHPFENSTPLSNFFEVLAILLIPAGLCYTFGKMVNDTRQGWALLIVMMIIFIVALSVTVWAEQAGNPLFDKLGVDQEASATQPGGNMEGKEVRFGITDSALWATATTSASNGSVNSMHDSFTPVGGLIPMWMMQLGEVVFGGVGSGLYGMLVFVIVGVFIAGLMIGRTPEYLGKKIEAYEMKMASLMVLIPIVIVLLGAAIAVLVPSSKSAVSNPGAHGFSEILYAFSSASNNNGSAFAGLSSNNFFYNVALGIAMFIGRYWLMIPALAIAGSLVQKKKVPTTPGTLPTHTPLFIIWLIAVVIIVGALSFFPALSLGPIVEQLMMR